MYNINFDMKRARYLVVSKSNYYKCKNGINTWNNWEYMENVYGIYTYSFEDVLTFLEKELVTYFSQNNLLSRRMNDRKNELYQYYKDFKIYDLKNEIYIGEEYYNRKHYFDRFSDLRDFKLFNYDPVSESTSIYISKSYELIAKVAEWNEVPYRLNYLYPTKEINKEYNYWGKRQHRTRFHTRCWNYLSLTKRESIAGSDPEYVPYLTMRQQHRDHCLNHAGYRKNRNNVPGDWNHYNKCRKQWAKNVDNPSYEKLSKAVWKQELEDMESDINCT